MASWCTTASRSLMTFVAKDAEHIVFQLYHRVIVPMFLKAGAYFLALFYELRCFTCFNVQHDFSLTSVTIEVSVAKHFHTQLLIREVYPHVALICKWGGTFQELVDTYVSRTGAFGLTGLSPGRNVCAGVLTVSCFIPLAFFACHFKNFRGSSCSLVDM